MSKLVLLKNVSFDVKNYDDIVKNLENSISYHEFTSTKELFYLLHSLLGSGSIEVVNCDFDSDQLIQGFYIEDYESKDSHKNIVLVKRLINKYDNTLEKIPTENSLSGDTLENHQNDFLKIPTENDTLKHYQTNDTYTFVGHEETNTLKYLDILYDDVVSIMMKKYKTQGVVINTDGKINDVDYSYVFDQKENTGLMTIRSVGNLLNLENLLEFKFYNVPGIPEEKISGDQFDIFLIKEMEKTKATHLFSQVDFGLGLLNCYYRLEGNVKNETMSKMMGSDVYGDVLVGLENSQNNDSRTLSLTSKTFNKLVNFFDKLKNNTYKPKNRLYCNIFYEIE